MNNGKNMREFAELVLGSRLKRLSDTFMKDVSSIYNEYEIDFNPKWFPVFYLLYKEGSFGIVELSERLDLSHPAISQFVKELETKGLIKSVPDKSDSRKRSISLSEKALEMIPKMEPLWDGMSKSLIDVFSKHANNILFAVEEMEESLKEKSFFDRVNQTIKTSRMDEVTILDFKLSLAKHFAELNFDWIKKYFTVEKQDEISLNNPKKYIIDKGGAILFAEYEGKIVGTVALINDGNGVYEMAKMAVDENYRGKQIGKKLGLAIIKKAKQLDAKEVYLVSNTILTPAIKLYERLGFKKVQLRESEYKRTNIEMLLKLK